MEEDRDLDPRGVGAQDNQAQLEGKLDSRGEVLEEGGRGQEERLD